MAHAHPTARDWIVDRLGLVARNTAELYHPLQHAARAAAAQHTPARADAIAANRAIGAAVCDELSEIITDDTRECADLRTRALLILLADILDLTDRTQQEMIGSLFRPDANDWPRAL